MRGLRLVAVAAVAALSAAAAGPADARCALPSAGVRLAEGLVRTCALPAVVGAGSDAGMRAFAPAPLCAGPLACTAWHADQRAPGTPGDGLLAARVIVPAADGATVYVASYEAGKPTVTAHRVSDGAATWSVQLPDPSAMPYAIARAQDGSLGVALTVIDGDDSEGFVWVVDPAGSTRGVVSTGADSEALDLAAAGPFLVAAGSRGSQAVATAVDPSDATVAWQRGWESSTPGARTNGWRVAGSADRAYLGAFSNGVGVTHEHTLITLAAADGTIERASTRTGEGFPPASIATSSDGSLVVVEEASWENNRNEMLTVAYTADGRQLWSARYRGCDAPNCSTRPWYGTPMAITPDGKQVLATGLGSIGGAVTAWATVAYDAATGEQQWEVRTPISARDCLCGPSVVASADHAYVTGTLEDTVASYNAITAALALGDGSTSWIGDDTAPAEVASSTGLTLAEGRVVTVGLAGLAVPYGERNIRTTVAAFAAG